MPRVCTRIDVTYTNEDPPLSNVWPMSKNQAIAEYERRLDGIWALPGTGNSWSRDGDVITWHHAALDYDEIITFTELPGYLPL